MNHMQRWISIAVMFLSFAALSHICLAQEEGPKYWDDYARKVLPGFLPFASPGPESKEPSALHVRRLCVQGKDMIAEVYNTLVHFDADKNSAHVESFPFDIFDLACGDAAHLRMLALSWPERHLYSIGVKPEGAWSGWRRSDPINLLKDESPLGYVEGDNEIRILTTHRLLSVKGDKVGKAIKLSKPIKPMAAARVSILRVGNDIYFGNDGGEWGGVLFRIDALTGKVSLALEGDPVVAIVADPNHSGCVLVARAMAHMMLAEGGLERACHDSTQTLIKGEPVWAVAGTKPVFVAFSDGIAELENDAIVNRREFPSADLVVAGLHYTTLPGAILVTTGVSQSVSLSGAAPMLVRTQMNETP